MNREQLLKPLKPIGIEGLVNWAFGVQWIGKRRVSANDDTGLMPELRMMQRLTASYEERIAGSGAVPVANDERHPQAMALYRAWLGLCWDNCTDAAEIVRSWGEVCGRPDWYPDGVERFVPVLDALGQPVPARDQNRHIAKASCKVVRVGHSRKTVSKARAEYAMWWEALSVLQLDMQDFVDKSPADCIYRITGGMPPKLPWLAGDAKKAPKDEKAA
jgi:hypothetical protein